MKKNSKKQIKDHSHYVTRQILATNIVYLRHLNGWSQEEFAERTGRSVSVLSDIENKKLSATIDMVDDIASAFNWTTSEITKDHGFIVTKKRVDSKQ